MFKRFTRNVSLEQKKISKQILNSEIFVLARYNTLSTENPAIYRKSLERISQNLAPILIRVRKNDIVRSLIQENSFYMVKTNPVLKMKGNLKIDPTISMKQTLL